MSDQLGLFEAPVSRETVAPAAEILGQALARRRDLDDQDDDGPGALSWVRCAHHQILHWRGIRCPVCTFRTTGPSPAVLAYGRRARRSDQDLISRRLVERGVVPARATTT